MAKLVSNLMHDLSKFEGGHTQDILTFLPIILISIIISFALIGSFTNFGIIMAMYTGIYILFIFAVLPIYFFFIIIKKNKT
jgi:uncharacterized RDD family membrane protein YckC